ncbi:MAG: peptidoglycan bridge formation glycyltransferase FemA/FemB family protein [Candidatus Gracilibacteria bacterium]|nr:peptidoglycan bridge formation glycyltransferase FemA/FemB family protein [Candidatus Gracilibacteria bacterium]
MSIWQTNSWKELLLASHQASDVFEVDGIFIEKRSLGLGQFGLFVLGIENLENINEEKLIELCKKENCLFIQVESFGVNKEINFKLKKFKSGYYKKFITPYTAIIDLTKSEEEILKEMKPKGRYNIGLAEKKGVEVLKVEKNDENVKIFHNLMKETTSRDKFNGNSLNYYFDFLNIIPNSSLIFTKLEDKILSAGIFVFDKEISIYYYGASTSDVNFRNLMAPYLMQWFAIKKAKEIGSKIYDFLGIATPGEEKSKLTGVTDFKLKFTKDIINCSESYICITSKFRFFLLKILKKLKSSL